MPAEPMVAKMLRLSPELNGAVIAYAKETGQNQADAMRELLAKGLGLPAKDDQQAPEREEG